MFSSATKYTETPNSYTNKHLVHFTPLLSLKLISPPLSLPPSLSILKFKARILAMDAASQLGYCGIEPLRRTFSTTKTSSLLHLSVPRRNRKLSRRNRLDVRAVATEPKPTATKTSGTGSSTSPASSKPVNGSFNSTINGSSTVLIPLFSIPQFQSDLDCYASQLFRNYK